MLRRDDHCDRASGTAQDLVHPAAEVEALFGRTEQRAHHEQVEFALFERTQDDALGIDASLDAGCYVQFELFGEFANLADSVLPFAVVAPPAASVRQSRIERWRT